MEVKHKKEFRVGNYFQPTDGSNEEYQEVSINDLVAWLDRGAIYGKPIPLTKDWLLSLGFEDTYFSDSGKLAGYRINDKDLLNDDMTLIWFNTEIKFVHQLQNFYYLLNNIELKTK